MGEQLAFQYLHDWLLTAALFGMAVLTGLAAGFYPALILSGFRLAMTLRVDGLGAETSSTVRAALVVMEFAVSIGLGIVTLVMFDQISFARTIDLGLNKERVVLIAANTLVPEARHSLVRAFNADPVLSGATISGDFPFSGSTGGVDSVQISGKPAIKFMRFVAIGPDFLSLYGIRLSGGRSLGWSDVHRKHSPFNILINSAAAKALGYSAERAIGKSFYAGADSGKPNQGVLATIVGVTSDFKFEGDRKAVVPTFYAFESSAGVISVKLPAARTSQALAAIDRTWHRFLPSLAIDRHFLDADFEKQFLADEQQGRVFTLFVGIAIFIACLGLFGLAAFSTERRTKEIGIRKVFGARTRDLVFLLLWQFSIPVLIANAIAWPFAWYYLHDWLQALPTASR